MNSLKLFFFVISIVSFYNINAQISDKRLCADIDCKVAVSQAKTLLRYASPDFRILSFSPNEDVTIYSKSAGSREDLWGAEIKGKRGYIPKKMVRETKILQKPTILVPTELGSDPQVPSPNRVQEPYEVVDGTTIYLPTGIDPSSTESTVESTTLPVAHDSVTQTVVESEEIKEDVVQNKESKVDEVNSTNESVEVDVSESLNNSEQSVEINQDVVQINNTEETTTEKVNNEIDHTESKNVSEENTTQLPELVENIEVNLKYELPETPIDVTTLSPEYEIPQPNYDEVPEHVTPNPILQVAEEVNVLKETFTTLPPLGLFDGVKSTPFTDETEKVDAIQKGDEIETKSEIVEDTINKTPETSEGGNIELKDQEIGESEVKDSSQETVVDKILEQNHEIIEEVPKTDENVGSTELNYDTSSTLPVTDNVTENESLEVEQREKIEIPESENSDIIGGLGFPIRPMTTKDSEPTEVFNYTDNTEAIENLEIPSESTITETESFKDSSQAVNTEVPLQETSETIENVEHVSPPETTTKESFKDSSQEVSSETAEALDVENLETGGDDGFFSNIVSFFNFGSKDEKANELEQFEKEQTTPSVIDNIDHEENIIEENFETSEEKNEVIGNIMDMFNSDIVLYLITTAASVIIFLLGYFALDKSKQQAPLIARINKLEKDLLIVVKENQLLQEKTSTDSGYETNDKVSNEVVETLKIELLEKTTTITALEDQVQSMEKELENSTEVGMELNRMLTEILSSQNGSDVLKANVEQLQRQLVEQQSTINSINETLAITNTENHELRLELELSNKKVLDLQAEVDKLLTNLLKIEEEKDTQQVVLENELTNIRQKYDEVTRNLKHKDEEYTIESRKLKSQLEQVQRRIELKTKEYDGLTETFKQLKIIKNNDSAALKNLLETGNIKAELQVLRVENESFSRKLQEEQELRNGYEKKAQNALDEIKELALKYDQADKLKVETETKLEVLSNYFKEREAQLQKEISNHEKIWAEKEGEATSTTERITFMQDQLQNYKTQTESLKQEIMSQEIELKSQISVLEKKAHENWVSARQAERKLEEAKQEAAQLRHRLTLRERAIQEDKNQRIQSPIEQNGDLMESPASPPLLYSSRDHITKSPPLPGLPPFLPPPPGVPFMPPPMHGVPPFIPPPPPNMYPGDHRPPPLGRMSSPPLNSRYSPNSRGYSPYDRHSSSPSDSEYGTSPPHRRAYSPFNYKRNQGRNNGRGLTKGGSSGSNDSLEKTHRQQSKV